VARRRAGPRPTPLRSVAPPLPLSPTGSIVVDSGAVYALYDADDLHHAGVRAVIEQHRGPLVLPLVLLSEIDYLLREFLGVDAELDFLASVDSGAFALEPFTGSDLTRARELIAAYRDRDLGLADAAVVATAERLRVHHLLTVDERDFRAVVPADGRPFALLPADAPSPAVPRRRR
jgi:uncharacterized protein